MITNNLNLNKMPSQTSMAIPFLKEMTGYLLTNNVQLQILKDA